MAARTYDSTHDRHEGTELQHSHQPASTLEPRVDNQNTGNNIRLAPIFGERNSSARDGSVNLPSLGHVDSVRMSPNMYGLRGSVYLNETPTSMPFRQRSVQGCLSSASGLPDTLTGPAIASPAPTLGFDRTLSRCLPPHGAHPGHSGLVPSPPPSKAGEAVRRTTRRLRGQGQNWSQLDREKREDHKHKEKMRREETKKIMDALRDKIPDLVVAVVTDSSRSFPYASGTDSGYGSDGEGGGLGVRIGTSRTNNNEVARNPQLLALLVNSDFKELCDQLGVREDSLTTERMTEMIKELTDKRELWLKGK